MWQCGRRAPGSPRSGPARGGGWRAGTIVAHFYESPEFPAGRCAPYQIKLDERLPGPRGMRELVFVSRDVNSMIREPDSSWA